MRDNVVTIIANVAERARDIDVTRAEQAKDKAEKVISDSSRSQSDVERAKIALSKAINRIGVSKHRIKTRGCFILSFIVVTKKLAEISASFFDFIRFL